MKAASNVVWLRIASTLVEHTNRFNALPVDDCLNLAKMVGPCTFTFFNDHYNVNWCRIKWSDGTETEIALEDTL